MTTIIKEETSISHSLNLADWVNAERLAEVDQWIAKYPERGDPDLVYPRCRQPDHPIDR